MEKSTVRKSFNFQKRLKGISSADLHFSKTSMDKDRKRFASGRISDFRFSFGEEKLPEAKKLSTLYRLTPNVYG